MLHFLKRALSRKSHAADDLEAISTVVEMGGVYRAIVLTADDPRWNAAMSRLAERGLVTMSTLETGELLVRIPTKPATKRPPVFNTERNPVWSAWVETFHRDHQRAPRAREMRKAFPEISRASAYRYIKHFGHSPEQPQRLRLVHAA